MNFKKSLILLVIFGIAAGAYWWDQKRITTHTTEDALNKRLVRPDKAKLTEITLRHGGKEIKLDKQGDAWRMTQPVNAAVDQTIVDSLLGAIDSGQRNNSDTIAASDLSKFGLEHPAASLEVRAGGENYAETFNLGSKAANGLDVFARSGDSLKVFIVPETIDNQVKEDARYYRDKRLLPLDVTGATSFTLAYGANRFVLDKPKDKWEMTAPRRDRADQTKVGDMLQAIASSRAEDFIDSGTQKLAAYGLTHPAWSGAVYAKEGDKPTSMTLWVSDVISSGTQNLRYAMRSGSSTILSVKPDLPVKLQPTLSDLRDKSMFSLAPADVGEVKIVSNIGTIDFVQDADHKWRFKGDPAKVDQNEASIKVSALTGLKALRFIDQPTSEGLTGLDRPTLKITVASKDGKTTETALTGKLSEDDSFVYGRRMDTGELVALDFKDPGKFMLSRDELLDKNLYDFAQDKVNKIVITQRSKTTSKVLTFTRGTGRWDAKSGSNESFTVQDADVTGMLDALTAMQWQKHLQPQVSADQGIIATQDLKTPGKTIEVYGQDGKEVAFLGQSDVPEAAPAIPTPTPAGASPIPTPGANTTKYVYITAGPDQFYAIEKDRFSTFKQAWDVLMAGLKKD